MRLERKLCPAQLTLMRRAAKVRIEPTLTDAARCMNVWFFCFAKELIVTFGRR